MTDGTLSSVEELDALNETLEDTDQIVDRFRRTLSETGREAERSRRSVTALERSISHDLRGAMTDMVFEGTRASDALRSVATSLARTVFQQSITPITNAVGGAVGGAISSVLTPGASSAFADGAAFASGRVQAFAQGGIVTAPTSFPMRGGVGLMGEAGPEAIMPLKRGADGRLGVATDGAGHASPQINVTINTPDPAAFGRSRAQIMAALSRAVSQGQGRA
jgi:phage-related minor tail protein